MPESLGRPISTIIIIEANVIAATAITLKFLRGRSPATFEILKWHLQGNLQLIATKKQNSKYKFP
jgi:hypothetical protein